MVSVCVDVTGTATAYGSHVLVRSLFFLFVQQDDPATVGEVQQAATTIRKAMVQVNELTSNGTPGPADYNQMVRWINTKEEHACKIITTVAEYCLCQRVKKDVFATEKEFTDAVMAHHAVMVAAMKCKQSVDTVTVDHLDTAIALFAKMYLPSSK